MRKPNEWSDIHLQLRHSVIGLVARQVPSPGASTSSNVRPLHGSKRKSLASTNAISASHLTQLPTAIAHSLVQGGRHRKNQNVVRQSRLFVHTDTMMFITTPFGMNAKLASKARLPSEKNNDRQLEPIKSTVFRATFPKIGFK